MMNDFFQELVQCPCTLAIAILLVSVGACMFGRFLYLKNKEGHCLLTFAPFFVQISWNLNQLGTPLDEVSLSLKRIIEHREIWRIATAGVSHLEGVHLASVLFGLWVCRAVEIEEGSTFFASAALVGFSVPSFLALAARDFCSHALAADGENNNRSNHPALSLIAGPPTCGFSPTVMCLMGAGNGSGSVPFLATLMCAVWYPTLAPQADYGLSHLISFFVGLTISTRAVGTDARSPYWIGMWFTFFAVVLLVSRRAYPPPPSSIRQQHPQEDGESVSLGNNSVENNSVGLRSLEPGQQQQGAGGSEHAGERPISGHESRGGVGGGGFQCCVHLDRCLASCIEVVNLEPSAALLADGLGPAGDDDGEAAAAAAAAAATDASVEGAARTIADGGGSEGGRQPASGDDDDGDRRSNSSRRSSGERVRIDLKTGRLPVDGLLALLDRRHRQRQPAATPPGSGRGHAGSEDGSGASGEDDDDERARLLEENVNGLNGGGRSPVNDDEWLLGDRAALLLALDEAWLLRWWRPPLSSSSSSSTSGTLAAAGGEEGVGGGGGGGSAPLVMEGFAGTALELVRVARALVVDLCGWGLALALPLLALAGVGLQVVWRRAQSLVRRIARAIRQRQRRAAEQPDPTTMSSSASSSSTIPMGVAGYDPRFFSQRHGGNNASSNASDSGFWGDGEGGGGGMGGLGGFQLPGNNRSSSGWETPPAEAMMLPPLMPHRQGTSTVVRHAGEWQMDGAGGCQNRRGGSQHDDNSEDSEFAEAIRRSKLEVGCGLRSFELPRGADSGGSRLKDGESSD